MNKNFKFFTENKELTYEGRMSLEVIQYFNEYVNNLSGYQITTELATYKMANYVYSQGGNIVAGTVNVYPIEEPSTRLVFEIRNGEITSHTIEYNYWNIAGQIINELTREQ